MTRFVCISLHCSELLKVIGMSLGWIWMSENVVEFPWNYANAFGGMWMRLYMYVNVLNMSKNVFEFVGSRMVFLKLLQIALRVLAAVHSGPTQQRSRTLCATVRETMRASLTAASAHSSLARITGYVRVRRHAQENQNISSPR